MLILILAMLAQDPNTTYQGLDRAAKERIYLVYDREARARQNVEAAVDATSKATSLPGGTVRLVVIEMKRDPKFVEQRKTAARGLLGKKEDKDTKKPTTKRKTSTSVGGGKTKVSSGRSKPASTKKKYTMDGITKVEGEERAKFAGKDQKIIDFHHSCSYVVPEDVETVNEKVAVAIDGQVRTPAKDWFVIDVMGADGTAVAPIVVLRIASTERMEGIHKGDRVRLWGFFADEAMIKAAEEAAKDEEEEVNLEETEEEKKKREKKAREEETRPGGRVFFVMDVDEATRDVPGLLLTCRVKEREDTGTKNRYWDIEVEAKNNGDRALTAVEVEANVNATGVKPKSAVDSAYVYFEKLEPGQSSVVKTKLIDWTELPEENSSTIRVGRIEGINQPTGPEVEEIAAFARPLGGKVSRE